MARGYDSRTSWAAAASAAMDRADHADRLQQSLEDAGYNVTRLIGDDVTVVLERPSGIPGLVNEWRYSGPTALDALRLAVSDVLQQETNG